ncbi:ribulose-5-phosphate 3-epimerase [Hydrogenispora ethanolica]|jgi:ribulose-phosphate 3-epimerase|uniref:Ribulose-phosphate 3-epimerase n=1 Tax=Hydrogenispora ethanolica TaxID=1082276 RepID=A0A4R1R8V1_HYDET|nr:ribulose-phosphate 3-epimerase [Hydrogenispora ethanolica]TCL62104.1 ribulose-5-phosphate 3-epimerase [Hydrogenispora ethanolica]
MVEIAPSILNANLLQLGEEVAKIRSADWVHFDVMDGHFVPNLTFGPMFVEALRQVTAVPIESHLMVENTAAFIPLYAQAGSKRIIIHAETGNHLHRLVQNIKELGCEAGVSLNPATPLSCLEYLLPDLDLVLLMTVNPGFGGQRLIPAMYEKIKQLRAIISERRLSCKIEVDGGVNLENAPRLVAAGVDVLVAGTLIYRDPDPAAALKRLRDGVQ